MGWLKTMEATVFLLLSLLSAGVFAYDDRILLRDVEALTLHDGEITTGRRSEGQPQLQCIGGSAVSHCEARGPAVVQCLNRGSDGVDIQWECTGEMDGRVHFGKITVSCEGYDHLDDPYILKGSCGLEYELDWRVHHSNSKTQPDLFARFMVLIFVLIIIKIISRIYQWCFPTAVGDATDRSATTTVNHCHHHSKSKSCNSTSSGGSRASTSSWLDWCWQKLICVLINRLFFEGDSGDDGAEGGSGYGGTKRR